MGTPLMFFSEVKDMPIENTWTTSTATTSIKATSTSSMIIMPGAQTPAPSTTTTTTTLDQGSDTTWMWLLLIPPLCLLGIASFMAFRMYSKQKGPGKRKRPLPAPEEHKPLVQKAEEPPPSAPLMT